MVCAWWVCDGVCMVGVRGDGVCMVCVRVDGVCRCEG